MKIVRTAPSTDQPATAPLRVDRGFNASQAVTYLKASGHPGRLAILGYLATGEKSVSMLETLMDTRQAAVSQQLARLRQEGLVQYRREGKTIYYRLSDGQVERFVSALQDIFRS